MRPLWLTIESGQKKFKNTKWYVNGILPRWDIRDKRTHNTNEALRFMCENLKINYIDTSSACQDDCFQQDAVHPNIKGADIISKLIVKSLELMTNTDQRETDDETNESRQKQYESDQKYDSVQTAGPSKNVSIDLLEDSQKLTTASPQKTLPSGISPNSQTTQMKTKT